MTNPNQTPFTNTPDDIAAAFASESPKLQGLMMTAIRMAMADRISNLAQRAAHEPEFTLYDHFIAHLMAAALHWNRAGQLISCGEGSELFHNILHKVGGILDNRPAGESPENIGPFQGAPDFADYLRSQGAEVVAAGSADDIIQAMTGAIPGTDVDDIDSRDYSGDNDSLGG